MSKLDSLSPGPQVAAAFTEQFGEAPALLVRAPGRVNLIGEHTDYNGGFVLPAAIDREICFALSLNGLEYVRLWSVDQREHHEVRLDEPLMPGPVAWANYLLGVVAELRRRGHRVPGFDCAFGGNVPMGAGLSSSAAVECGLAYALNRLLGLALNGLALAQVAQAAEHTFAGVQCGLMDQFASVMSQAGQVVRLDCRALSWNYYPFDPAAVHLVLCNSGVKHNLAESGYNERRAQCEAGVAALRHYYPDLETLRDVTPAQLAAHKAELDPVVYRRCRYVLAENTRVLAACDHLQAGDLTAFGQLLYESHAGLRDDYQVSCPELDALVEAAKPLPGVFGARMMGGGFGGCTINLVAPDAVAGFEAAVRATFADRFGYEPAVYVARIVAGVSELPLPVTA